MTPSKWVRPTFPPLEPQLQAAKAVLSPAEYAKYEKMMVDLDRWVCRNNDGREFENSGEIDKAIACYELNVSEGFDGSHPYERLRIIYFAQGKISEAIRVCKAAIANEKLNNPELKEKLAKWIEKHGK